MRKEGEQIIHDGKVMKFKHYLPKEIIGCTRCDILRTAKLGCPHIMHCIGGYFVLDEDQQNGKLIKRKKVEVFK